MSQSLIQEKGVEIHVISPYKETLELVENEIFVHFLESKQTSNIEHVLSNFKCMLPKYRYNGSVKSIIEKVIEINPDIVHVHGTYFPFSIVVLLLKQLTPYPIVFTVHASIHQETKYTASFPKKYYMYLKSIPLFYYKSKSLKTADKIIAVSEPIKNIILRYIDDEMKVCVIPNGVNIREFEISSASSEKINHPSILFLGRLVKVKGCDVLINSLPEVKKNFPNIRYYIAGEGNQKDSLDCLASKLKVKDNIIFLGHITGSEKRNILKSVDICVFPSRYESFGIVALEAMACGKPIIASNVGGLPYIVIDGENGFLFKCNDSKQLSAKIIELLAHENLRIQMGELGKKMVINCFNWDLIVHEIYTVYEECLNEQR